MFTKKRLIIASVALLVVALGIYFGVPKVKNITTVTPPLPASSNTNQPGTAPVIMPKLISGPATNFWINQADKKIYFATTEGEVFKVVPGGEPEKISATKFQKFSSITASPSGRYLLAKFGNPIEPFFSVFSIITRRWNPMPFGTTAAAFNPDQAVPELAYLRIENGRGVLGIYDISVEKSRDVVQISYQNLNLLWPRVNELLLADYPTASVNSSLWQINLTDKTITTLFSDLAGLMTTWSQDGQAGIVSYSEDVAQKMKLVDGKGNQIFAIPLTSLATKCSFSGTGVGLELFCAIPANLPVPSYLPDEYLTKKIYTDDRIFSFKSITTSAPRVTIFWNRPDTASFAPVDIEKIEIAGDTLYFLNRYDRMLYSLSLVSGERESNLDSKNFQPELLP